MSTSQQCRRSASRSVLIASLLSLAVAAPAFAGECPKDKVGNNPLPGAATAPVGVMEMELSSIDLSKESVKLPERRLRYRPANALNPEVPAWVDGALARAVAIEPARRYRELSEFTYDLAHPNPGLATAPKPLLERGTAQQWRGAALALAVALALAILRWPEIGLLGGR